MRNLKKFLALVLAMMMTLSLMVTVNAKESYPDLDKADEAFVEAIDVLSGVGVIRGDETGNYNPGNNITRAEAAAIMYRVVTGDVKDDNAGLHVGVDNFTDVKGTEWFAGYVGYCVDHGIIKGRTDGRFDPSSNVTGYEMLAMLLRAIGYGQKGEFTGKGWEIPVGSRATTLGILDNVKTTSYGGNLRTAARRDVVADLVFQAMIGPATVTMSSLGDYNEYTSLVSNIKNPTLGKKVFGLTKMTGIIVGNQMTGESNTLLGVNVNWNSSDGGWYGVGSNGSFVYNTDPGVAAGANPAVAAKSATIQFATETGLELFGHKVDVWYDWNTDEDTQAIGETSVTYASTLPAKFNGIYAVRDLASKVEVVKADPQTANKPDVSDTTTDGELGKVAKAAGFTVNGSTKVQFSDAFEKFGSAAVGDGIAANTPGAAFDNATKEIYMLISNSANESLDVVINLGVSLDQVDAKNDYAANKTVTHDIDTTTIYRSVPTAKDQSLLIYGEEDITVGARVVLNKIYGTGTEGITTAGTQFYYGINKITEKKQGTVTAISGTGEVTLSNGETIEQSVLWDTANAHCGSANLKIGATLTFFLDTYGKYVRVVKDLDTRLIGAYGYWVQEGIDGFKYYLQGVDVEGKVQVVEVTEKTYKDVIANVASTARDIHFMGVANGTQGNNQYVGVLDPTTAGGLGYELYNVNGNKVLSKLAWLDQIVDSGDTTPVINRVWNKNTKVIMDWGDDGNQGGTGDNADTPNYFTNDTKFHVITGWGSTLKVETVTGLNALLNGAASVEVEGWYLTDTDDTEHVGSKNNVVTDVYLVSVKRIQPTTFLYSEKAYTPAATDPMTDDGEAVQYQIRVAGEKGTSGILASKIGANATVSSGAPAAAAVLEAHKFYTYTLDASGYYVLTADTTYSWTQKTLTNAATAFGDITEGTNTIHAADAKVIDITGVDHGITDYMSLRRAVEENTGIKVDVLLSSAMNGTTGTAIVIYVTAVA